MPQVPELRVPTVLPSGPAAPYVNVHATPEMFGLQVAEAESRLGQSVGQVSDVTANAAIRFQKLRNETEVDDTYSNKFSPAFRDLYQKYYSLQGKEALDKMPEYVKEMEKLQKETTDGMKNQAQRHLFQQTARRRIQVELDGMARYADQQNKVWMEQTSDSFLNNQLDQAADFHNDEQKFGSAIGTGLAEIDRYGAATHQSPEKIRDRASRFVSNAWVSRIERQLIDDPLEGQRVYKENEKSIDAKVRAPLEQKIKQAVWPVEARNMADEVMKDVPSKAVDIRAMLGTWSEEVEKRAQKSHPDNPVFRDMALARVQHAVNTYATAQAGQERSDRNFLLGLTEGDGTPESKPTSLEQLTSTVQGKQAWARLDSFSQTALLTRLELNQRKTDPPLNEASLGTYYQLKGLSTSDPDAFLNTDLMKHSKVLPHALMHELIGQQTAQARKEVRDQEHMLNVNHALSIARPALIAAGVDVKAKPGTSKAATYDQFVGRYTQQVDQFIANNKRRPNDKELQEITNSLLTSGAKSGSGWFFNDKARAFQVPPEQFYVPVPKGERQKIVDDFVRVRGHAPTDAQVQQVYTLDQLRKGAK